MPPLDGDTRLFHETAVKTFTLKNTKACFEQGSSLSIFHSYCVEDTCMGKTFFSSSTEAFYITQWNCMSIGSCRIKKTNNGSAVARKPMPKGEGHLAIQTATSPPHLRFLLFSDQDPSLLTLQRRDLPLKCLSSWIGPLAATSLQILPPPAAIR